MSNRPPHGNLTAALVIVASLELVIDRLLGRLFLSPGCHTGLGCAVLEAGPFLLYLTGALSVMVTAAGIAGHLKRGELFPRGVRLTITALSAVFLLLVALSLLVGQMPDRYQTHLQTSFAFVVALLGLSLLGGDANTAPARVRAGFVLFALPELLHISALLTSRAGWWRHGWMSPDRLTTAGEALLLLAAATSPVTLLSRDVPRSRLGAALAFAAGSTAFFFVALMGRTDLVQTVALYTVHLELPRALSLLGACYAVALFGFVTSLGVLLLSPGAPRLTGLGLALVALAGFQTSSPIALSVALCGLLSVATGALREGSTLNASVPRSPAETWRAWLTAVAAALADPPKGTSESGPQLIEIAEGDDAGSTVATVRVPRGDRQVALDMKRTNGVIRDIRVTVGVPGPDAPDATIESHEAWLGRRPQDRTALPRTKTGDPAFDRKLGVYGRAPLDDRGLRRRILKLTDGTLTLWSGSGARFVSVAPGVSGHRATVAVGSSGTRALVDIVSALGDLIRASDLPAAPDAAE